MRLVIYSRAGLVISTSHHGAAVSLALTRMHFRKRCTIPAARVSTRVFRSADSLTKKWKRRIILNVQHILNACSILRLFQFIQYAHSRSYVLILWFARGQQGIICMEDKRISFIENLHIKRNTQRWILFTISDVLFSFYPFVSILFYIHEISRLDSICEGRNAFPFKETMHIARVSLDLQEKKIEMRQFFVKSFYDKSFICFFFSYYFLTALKICYDLERLRRIASRGNQNVRYSFILNFILSSLN